jgi:hypothetical protein
MYRLKLVYKCKVLAVLGIVACSSNSLKIFMAIKKYVEKLNCDVRKDDGVINIFTDGKKSHFTCTEAQLFETLELFLNDTHKFYQVHLTTYPTIAVHITGNAAMIKKNENELREKIIAALNSQHFKGNA